MPYDGKIVKVFNGGPPFFDLLFPVLKLNC